MSKITPSNLAAQLSYRGRGNPFSTHPESAISNCFPGLEFDFRTIWRRMFVGIELSEHNNYVVRAEPQWNGLVGHRLLYIDDSAEFATSVATRGDVNPGFGPQPIVSTGNPNGVSFMEWSNNLARIWGKQGRSVTCLFTPEPSEQEVVPPADRTKLLRVDLEVRWMFERSAVDNRPTAALATALADPGELSEGLCSPWQNDYRECACYYWAASRPDFVNVVDSPEGVAAGDQWLTKAYRGTYIPDDRTDPRLFSYDDLFKAWQKHLRFIIGGSDDEDAQQRKTDQS